MFEVPAFHVPNTINISQEKNKDNNLVMPRTFIRRSRSTISWTFWINSSLVASTERSGWSSFSVYFRYLTGSKHKLSFVMERSPRVFHITQLSNYVISFRNSYHLIYYQTLPVVCVQARKLSTKDNRTTRIFIE